MLNITINGKELKSISEKAQAAMMKTSYVNAFNWIVLKAESGKLSSNVTSLDSRLTVYAKESTFDILNDGEIAIDKEDIKVICKMAGDVNIIEDDKCIIVKCGKKNINLMKHDMEGFPASIPEDYMNRLKCVEYDLAETLNNLSAFTSKDDNNKTTQCLHINFYEHRWESLDGYKIITKHIDNDDIYSAENSCSSNLLIHSMAIKDLSKTLDKKSHCPVYIAEGNKYIFIIGKDFEYRIRKVDGTFFDVQKMLNDKSDYSFIADSKEILNHIKYYTDNVIKKGVKNPIMLKIEGDKIISYGRNDRFETSDELPIEDFKGKELIIGFNPHYLVEALKIADSDKIIVSGNNSKSPLYIKADKYSFLILPVRLVPDTVSYMEKYLERNIVA